MKEKELRRSLAVFPDWKCYEADRLDQLARFVIMKIRD